MKKSRGMLGDEMSNLKGKDEHAIQMKKGTKQKRGEAS
jgi:hypothetical protein